MKCSLIFCRVCLVHYLYSEKQYKHYTLFCYCDIHGRLDRTDRASSFDDSTPHSEGCLVSVSFFVHLAVSLRRPVYSALMKDFICSSGFGQHPLRSPFISLYLVCIRKPPEQQEPPLFSLIYLPVVEKTTSDKMVRDKQTQDPVT